MSKAKRYECTDEGSTYGDYGAPIMKEDTTGNYVRYLDYEKLKAQLERVENMLSHSKELLERLMESHKYSLDNQLNLRASKQYGFLFLLDDEGRMIFKFTKDAIFLVKINEYFKEKE